VQRGWQFAGLGFLGLFAFAIWKSLSLPLRDALGPGPGFFPFWLGLIGALLAGLLVIEVSRARDMGPPLAELIPESGALGRIAGVVVLLAAATFAFEPLGFRFTILAFSLLLLPALGIRSPIAILAFALTASLVVFHVFYHWLKVPLPIGPYDHVFKIIGL
jgi:putative tricarboxylic transport membrane protein